MLFTVDQKQFGLIRFKTILNPLFLASFFFTTLPPLLGNPLHLARDSAYDLLPFVSKYTGTETGSIESIKGSSDLKATFPIMNIGTETDGISWYRFSLKNDSSLESWFVKFHNTRFDRIELYAFGDDGSSIKKIAGDTIPISGWSDPDLYFAFKLPVKKGEVIDCYLKIQNKSRALTSVTISGPLTFAAEKTEINYSLLFLTAVIFLFILYVLNLYRIYKQKLYLYIIPVGVIFYLFTCALIAPTYFFWPEWPALQDRIILLTGNFLIIILVSFLYQYLDIKKNQPILAFSFVLIIIVFLLFTFVLFLYNGSFFYKLLMVSGFAVYAITLTAIIRSSRFGVPTGDLLLLYTFMTITVLYRMGIVLNLLPYSSWFEWSSYIQLPLILFFFSRLGLKNMTTISINSLELETQYNELKKQLGEKQKKENSSRVSGMDVGLILKKIDTIVEKEGALFNPDFSLGQMASMLEIRSDQLSHILNQELKMSFSNFLNTIRVHHSCELMRKHPDKTITRLMLECGFSSKSSFNAAFKKVMNMSPREFRNHPEKASPIQGRPG